MANPNQDGLDSGVGEGKIKKSSNFFKPLLRYSQLALLDYTKDSILSNWARPIAEWISPIFKL
jgi:hypothetical protein